MCAHRVRVCLQGLREIERAREKASDTERGRERLSDREAERGRERERERTRESESVCERERARARAPAWKAVWRVTPASGRASTLSLLYPSNGQGVKFDPQRSYAGRRALR